MLRCTGGFESRHVWAEGDQHPGRVRGVFWSSGHLCDTCIAQLCYRDFRFYSLKNATAVKPEERGSAVLQSRWEEPGTGTAQLESVGEEKDSDL